MDYKEYRRVKKRLETARKFMRISNTMLRDIKQELSENDVVCVGIDDAKLSEAIDSLNGYITVFTGGYVPDNGQLELFN